MVRFIGRACSQQIAGSSAFVIVQGSSLMRSLMCRLKSLIMSFKL